MTWTFGPSFRWFALTSRCASSSQSRLNRHRQTPQHGGPRQPSAELLRPFPILLGGANAEDDTRRRLPRPSRARGYPDDGLDNLVVADKSCNGFKSSSLAATNRRLRGSRRFANESDECRQLAELAQRTAWDRHARRSLSVARAIYLRLPADARLWVRGKEFIPPDLRAIGAALM
jgi:hypothetical protein